MDFIKKMDKWTVKQKNVDSKVKNYTRQIIGDKKAKEKKYRFKTYKDYPIIYAYVVFAT